MENAPAAVLEEFGERLLAAAGMTREESRTVARHVVWASLRGVDSHGVSRIPVYAQRVREGGIVSPTKIETVSETPAVLVIDGGDGVGQVIGEHATDVAVERARRFGVAAVGVRHGNHLGALAAYTHRAAEHGMIGIAMTNASPRIAPTGGAEPLLGNNPWSVAVPAPGRPLVVDMATSVAALGKVRLIQQRGEQLPEGWARDVDGLPTTDPAAAISGLLEPIGGHKGYAISLAVDLLAGVLSGSRDGPDVGVLTDSARTGGQGHLFLALSVEAFLPVADYERRVGEVADRLRSSRRSPGVDAIHVPGDIEDGVERRRRTDGVPLSDGIAAGLRRTATELRVDVPAWLAA